MNVENTISTAGRRNLTVRLQVESKKGQIEVFEVEAYGQRQKGSVQLVFCLDVKSFEYKNIDLAMILSAEMTKSLFKPRFPISF
jgi:hypothetical protein